MGLQLHRARGHVPTLLQMAGHGGTESGKTKKKQESDKTVLTITKALAKTTNCNCKAKKVDEHDQKKLPALRA